MDEIGGKCSVALILIAILVLAVNYNLLSAEILSFSIANISLANIKTNGILLPAAAIAVILGCGICHVRHVWPGIYELYSQGYKQSAGVVELVRSEVATAAQDAKYGAPYGGICGSFKPTEQPLGQFTRPDGSSSPMVVIRLKGAVHWLAVRSGLRRMLSRRLWLGSYGPILLGLWALMSVAL
jgi:hypothetical protein